MDTPLTIPTQTAATWRAYLAALQAKEAALSRQARLERDIDCWIEEVGFAAMLQALLTTCDYWTTHAECGDAPRPIEENQMLWAARAQALRQAQQADRPSGGRHGG